MTYKENITAILECYFTGFKKEIIDSACNRILEQQPCEDTISRADAVRVASGYCHPSNIAKELARLPPVTPKQRWIPVSERLPNDRDWYLGIFKEPDTGWINHLPFICDYVGSETKATTKEHWILRGFTDRDERIDYYFNLECVAWMPLPKTYEPQLSEHEKFILSQMVNSDAKTIEEIGLMRQKQLAEIYQHCGCQKIEPQESEE